MIPPRAQFTTRTPFLHLIGGTNHIQPLVHMACSERLNHGSSYK
jgi:hypothetical protein